MTQCFYLLSKYQVIEGIETASTESTATDRAKDELPIYLEVPLLLLLSLSLSEMRLKSVSYYLALIEIACKIFESRIENREPVCL